MICAICGREFPDDSPEILDCDICLKMICLDCWGSEQHSELDEEVDRLG